MQRLLLALLLTCATYGLSAQILVDGIDIQRVDISFIEISANGRLFSNRINVIVDYGQRRRSFDIQRIENDRGKSMKFNSMMDALNFFYRNGWEYVDNYQDNDDNTLRRYLLRRMPSNQPEIKYRMEDLNAADDDEDEDEDDDQ